MEPTKNQLQQLSQDLPRNEPKVTRVVRAVTPGDTVIIGRDIAIIASVYGDRIKLVLSAPEHVNIGVYLQKHLDKSKVMEEVKDIHPTILRLAEHNATIFNETKLGETECP